MNSNLNEIILQFKENLIALTHNRNYILNQDIYPKIRAILNEIDSLCFLSLPAIGRNSWNSSHEILNPKNSNVFSKFSLIKCRIKTFFY